MATPQVSSSTCVICHARLPPRVLTRRSSYPLLRNEKRYAYFRSHAAHVLHGDLINTIRNRHAPILPVSLYPQLLDPYEVALLRLQLALVPSYKAGIAQGLYKPKSLTMLVIDLARVVKRNCEHRRACNQAERDVQLTAFDSKRRREN